MYARPFFLTLRGTDNLPENRKRQYVNKRGRACVPTPSSNDTKTKAVLFFRQAKYNARLTRCNIREDDLVLGLRSRERIAGMPEQFKPGNVPHAGAVGPRASRLYGPLVATPTSTGCSAGELQRQPSSVFWNANDFSILTRCATEKLSRLPGIGFGLPALISQQVPVQLEAIGLQTANGESTTISTAAITVAFCSVISRLI